MKKKKKNSKQFDRMFKKRFFTRKSVTVLIFALIIIVGLGIGCYRQQKKAKEYEAAIQELSIQIDELNQTNEELEEEKDSIDTAEFKEKMARERLGMIGENEYSLQQSEKGAADDTQAEEDSDDAKTDGGDTDDTQSENTDDDNADADKEQ